MDLTLLMALLRTALWGGSLEDSTLEQLRALDGKGWDELMEAADQQTVTGLIYKAAEKLPEGFPLPEEHFWNLMQRVNLIVNRNHLLASVQKEILALLSAGGLHPLVMKGSTCAARYPVPELRVSGDIDLYLSSDDFSRAPELLHAAGLSFSERPDGSIEAGVRGCVVELHRRYYDLDVPVASLPSVPSPEAELVMLSAHILKHACGVGVGLRQICDFALAWRQYTGDREALEALFESIGLGKWNRLLLNFIHAYIDPSVTVLPLSPRPLLRIVQGGGNFGHYAGDRLSHLARPARTRKVDTALRLLSRLPFSLRFAPREAFATFRRLIHGNVMKKTVILLSTALLLVIPDSCQRLNLSGRSVVFTAAANASATKTTYSGVINDGREDIYWNTDDRILIQSSDPAVASTPSNESFALYTLTVDADHPATASLKNIGEHGLIWNETAEVTFYGVYPGSTEVAAPGKFNMTIPSSQSFASPTETDMAHAYMVAKTRVEVDEDEVNMQFDPVFTAFEIHMKSKDEEITLTRFAIKSESQDLAGDFCLDWTGADMSFDAVSGGSRQKEVYVDFGEDGAVISPDREICFTLLALPDDLTGLYLEVSFKDSGAVLTKKLHLKQDNAYLTFTGCDKHRITGLAFDGGSSWRLTIDGQASTWDREDSDTSFALNIESGPFVISNATETGNHYYPAGTKDYQVRTLDLENGKNFFEVTFQPSAPLGGYWMLIPESNGGMGTAAFRIVVWDQEDNPNDPTAGNPDLKGQIMNQPVTLHVISLVTDQQRTEDHAIIFRSYFSTSVSFDENSTYSADSEIQDAHQDGSFSYWRFVIPAKNH